MAEEKLPLLLQNEEDERFLPDFLISSEKTFRVSESPEDGLYLTFEKGYLCLKEGKTSFYGDLTALKRRLSKSNLKKEALVRAMRLPDSPEGPISFCDGTAGLGEDSLILSTQCDKIFLYEKDPIIASLLIDSIRRAKEDPDLSPLAGKMIVRHGDFLQSEEKQFNAVYLDPMFPLREKTGLIKKKFQFLHRLSPPCENEGELLEGALNRACIKVVVKRPENAPPLASIKPDYSVPGDVIRYDVYVKKTN